MILRVLDADEGRMNARRAARLAGDPDADPETAEYVESDYGYSYMVYPRAFLGLFFRYDANVEEGSGVYETYGAEGRLKYEWLDDGNTFRLRMPEDVAGPCESGEWVLHF